MYGAPSIPCRALAVSASGRRSEGTCVPDRDILSKGPIMVFRVGARVCFVESTVIPLAQSQVNLGAHSTGTLEVP